MGLPVLLALSDTVAVAEDVAEWQVEMELVIVRESDDEALPVLEFVSLSLLETMEVADIVDETFAEEETNEVEEGDLV